MGPFFSLKLWTYQNLFDYNLLSQAKLWLPFLLIPLLPSTLGLSISRLEYQKFWALGFLHLSGLFTIPLFVYHTSKEVGILINSINYELLCGTCVKTSGLLTLTIKRLG